MELSVKSCWNITMVFLLFFGSVAWSTAARSLNGTCCSTLESLLPGMVFYNGDDTFEESMSTYWTAQEADYPPACIVRPVTTQDLSVAVQSLANISEAIDDKPCYFAVRSGGSGHDHKSNEPDGVNIDLTTWKTIHLPPDHKTAQIRPGYTFAEVYAYLEQYNLTVAGPRYATIGVGGYSLGGGISYLSPQVGFGSDTVVNFEVMLSTGEIVSANASSNPDLYRALKGGQNNFAIVTRVDFSTFPLGKILGGTVIQNSNTIGAQIKTLNNFATSEYDEKSNIIQSFGYNGQRVDAVNNLVYMEAAERLPPTLQQFVDLGVPTLNSIKNTSLSAIVGPGTGNGPSKNSRHVIYTTTFKPSVNMLNTAFNIWNTSTVNLLMLDISYTLAFEPIPKVLLSQSRKRGGNVLGLTSSDGPLIVVLLTAAWNDPKFDTLVDTTAEDCIQAIDQAASEMGMLNPYKYIGYAEKHQEVFQGYGEKNVEFMKTVSRKYDSRQIFQNLVRGGFKLPKPN